MRRSMFHITAMGYLLVLSFPPFLDSLGNTCDFQVLGDLKKIISAYFTLPVLPTFWLIQVCPASPTPGLGIRLFAHRSFAHFTQIKWAALSDSLKTNERLWVNHSGHSYQKSDCERIAQVAHDKWATVSDLLRSLMINKRFAHNFV